MIRRAVAACVFAVAAALSLGSAPADARALFDVRAQGGVAFFADVFALVGRDGASIAVRGGPHFTADSVYVDLLHDRIVLGGNARAQRGTTIVQADAIAFDIDSGAVDVLDAATGARHGTAALTNFVAEPIDSDRFAFPDIDPRRAFIRGKRATVTPHANVRFSPAIFPNSPGAVPVPSYLYTFATNPSFGANALGGATFDQPYGLIGGPNALLAAHFRYETGIGATFALDDHLVYGDKAYIVTSIDSPLRSDRLAQITAYQQLGSRYTQSLTAFSGPFGEGGNYVLGAALGRSSAQFSYARADALSSLDMSARTPDRPLIAGVTYHLKADLGFDALPGGLLSQLPDRHSYATVWRHGVDLFAATPLLHAPLKTTIGTTVDLSRTWYAFPHHFDNLSTTTTVSKTLTKAVTLIGTYTTTFSYDVFPNAQALFYPTATNPTIAPDGTPWPGFSAFSGASNARGYTLQAYYAPKTSSTSIRAALSRFDDFPQFHGFGRPPYQVSFDAQFRPVPNIGIDIGRAYLFDWGGQRFTRWTFAILP